MNYDPDSVKQWLSDSGRDRAWLAEEIGVSKRTLDNWFGAEFPLYAQKAIGRIAKELEPEPKGAEDALQFSMKEWKEIARRARECGFEDEIEYLNEFLKQKLTEGQ